MNETEINLKDLLFTILRRWRCIINVAIILAVALAVFNTVTAIIDMNDEEVVAKWQEEYDAAYGAYWAVINDLERQISDNERLAAQERLTIERLERQEAEYISQIEDTTERIAYYNSVVEDYLANIEVLNQ